MTDNSTLPLPHPYGVKFPQWAAAAAERWAAYGVAAPALEADWLTWASALFFVPELSGLPSPVGFSDWRAWASRVMETVT